MKLLVCDKTHARAIAEMQAAGIQVDERLGMTPGELLDAMPAYEAMVVRSATVVTATVIDAAPHLRLIVRGGVGLDNIDLDYARNKGIVVHNTPRASADAAAELTIGYLFCLARHIPQATASMRAGQWKKKQLKGTEIQGTTLGLIGFGNIGQAVGRRAHDLGMHVLFYRRTPTRVDYARQVSFDELLAASDYVSLHVPLTPETANLVDAEAFSKIKKGAYVVHCGRGGTLDENALYEALQSGKVAGAALDVWADEKVVRGNPRLFELLDKNGLPLVIGSPHIGAATAEGQERVGQEVARTVIEFYRSSQ
jgi:D-3-phosphoglycerate dehydrogenase / 2-oxoglutarate reductase